ncbi:MAG TPA: hypothetical protein VK762_27985, partial [Polyangiaceae bacterium]|nr:hypothetical protein [Polyangiaceae bacterium]
MTRTHGSSRIRRWAGPWVRALSLALAVLASGLSAGTARAEGSATFDLAIKGLASTSTEAVTHAIETLGATEDPRALKILQALDDGNVVVSDDGGVYIKDAGGALHDAATGAPASPASSHPMVVDNQIRRVLAPLMAQLELRSPDPKA